MNITLTRRPSAHGCTIGLLAINVRFECYTCEDVERDGPKVYGQTAIPHGRYRVIITRSERFSRLAGHDVFLPLLLDVPGFEGIRIHPGNTADHTDGCILPGLSFTSTGVGQSVVAFAALFAKIEAAIAAGEEVWIEIRRVELQGIAKPTTPPKPAAPAAVEDKAPKARFPEPAGAEGGMG